VRIAESEDSEVNSRDTTGSASARARVLLKIPRPIREIDRKLDSMGL
jgi:hypothetical protein